MSQQPYGQQPYGQQPYGQAPHGQQPYGQAPYGQVPYSQQPYGYVPMTPPKSKIAAGVLAILIGTFGIHNFYLGHTKRGLAQLLMTILSFGILAPISAIWALVEGIMILISNPTTPWAYDAQGQLLS